MQHIEQIFFDNGQNVPGEHLRKSIIETDFDSLVNTLRTSYVDQLSIVAEYVPRFTNWLAVEMSAAPEFIPPRFHIHGAADKQERTLVGRRLSDVLFECRLRRGAMQTVVFNQRPDPYSVSAAEHHVLSVCCPIEDRKLEVVEKPNKWNRFTINPVTGRCSFKFVPGTDVMARLAMLIVISDIMRDDEMQPFTFRGQFKFTKRHVTIVLQTESKEFSRKYSKSY
jgi:hypothetical protein